MSLHFYRLIKYTDEIRTFEPIGQRDPIGRETLAVPTPVRIELDNPQGLAVVDQVRHVHIHQLDNIILLSKNWKCSLFGINL